MLAEQECSRFRLVICTLVVAEIDLHRKKVSLASFGILDYL